MTTDIGAPVGQECSIAYSINSKRQVVGESTGLFLHVSNLFMFDAWYINDRGEIPGTAYNADTGEIHAVLLVPQGDCDDDCEARIAASQHDAAATARARTMAGAIIRNRERESAHANSNRYRFHGVGVQPKK